MKLKVNYDYLGIGLTYKLYLCINQITIRLASIKNMLVISKLLAQSHEIMYSKCTNM